MRDIIDSLRYITYHDPFVMKTVVELYDPITDEDYWFSYDPFDVPPEDAVAKAYRDLAWQWGTVL